MGSMIEHKVQMADEPERISVKHRKCWGTLFNGRFTRFTRFNVAVNHGSTLEFSTIFGVARGAKAAAEAGKRVIGIVMLFDEEESGAEVDIYERKYNKSSGHQSDSASRE